MNVEEARRLGACGLWASGRKLGYRTLIRIGLRGRFMDGGSLYMGTSAHNRQPYVSVDTLRTHWVGVDPVADSTRNIMPGLWSHLVLPCAGRQSGLLVQCFGCWHGRSAPSLAPCDHEKGSQAQHRSHRKEQAQLEKVVKRKVSC